MTGIIDGTGSLGAAIGQIIIGEVQEKSWNGVFIILSCTVFVSAMVLVRSLFKEIGEIRALSKKAKLNRDAEEKVRKSQLNRETGTLKLSEEPHMDLHNQTPSTVAFQALHGGQKPQ